MTNVFAGARSVPVIRQALDILGKDYKQPVMDSEDQPDRIPPGAIFLAACNPQASFPSRFTRRLPERVPVGSGFSSLHELRVDESERRQYDVPERVLRIPHVILVRLAPLGDGTYTGTGLVGFVDSLKTHAGIRPVRTHQVNTVRARRSGHDHFVHGCGIQPHLVF